MPHSRSDAAAPTTMEGRWTTLWRRTAGHSTCAPSPAASHPPPADAEVARGRPPAPPAALDSGRSGRRPPPLASATHPRRRTKRRPRQRLQRRTTCPTLHPAPLAEAPQRSSEPLRPYQSSQAEGGEAEGGEVEEEAQQRLPVEPIDETMSAPAMRRRVRRETQSAQGWEVEGHHAELRRGPRRAVAKWRARGVEVEVVELRSALARPLRRRPRVARRLHRRRSGEAQRRRRRRRKTTRDRRGRLGRCTPSRLLGVPAAPRRPLPGLPSPKSPPPLLHLSAPRLDSCSSQR